MFKSLRKAAQPIMAAAERIANTVKSDSAIVQEIHDDFETASQKAVDEAKKILDTLGNADTKAQVDILSAAGFRNVPMVKNWHIDNQKRALAEERIKVVGKYTVKYPGQKFIFIDQVKEICKRYGLLCTPVSKYKGDVPQKNILEISNFKVLPEDSYLEQTFSWSDRVLFDFTKRGNFINKIEAKRMRDEADRRGRMAMMENALLNYGSYPSMPTLTEVPMFICAPKGDLIVENDDKVSNDVFMTREIKDPIVLQYVGDGFLVVSKWGPEAQDKDLVNENMN